MHLNYVLPLRCLLVCLYYLRYNISAPKASGKHKQDAKRSTRVSVNGRITVRLSLSPSRTAKHIRTTTIPVPRRVFNTTMTTSFAASLDAIKAVLPANLQRPRVAIICGSGLSGIVDALRDVVLVPYQNIPGFSTSTGKYTILATTCSKFLHSVPGHKSALAFGFLGNGEGVPVVAMLGRVRKTALR